MVAWTWMALLWTGCGAPGPDAQDWTCVVPGDLESGAVRADIDGESWSAGSLTYLWAGASLQLTTDATDGWRFSAVAQTTTDGVAVAEALDELPVEIAMESGSEGGFAVVYPDSGASMQTVSEGGGLMVIDSDADDDLWGCLHFDAWSDSGDDGVSVDASFRAALSDL